VSASLRILWLKTGPLHPLDTGGKIRTYHMLRELCRSHRVTYLSLCPVSAGDTIRRDAREYSQEAVWIPWDATSKTSVRLYANLLCNFAFSRRPYSIDKYESVAMAAKIQELEGLKRHDLIVCDFLTPAVNLRFGERRSSTPVLLFQHNVENLIWKRTAETARGWHRRAYFRSQWQRMATFEREVCQRVDGVVGVSDLDCDLMRREFGLNNVLGAVPTGVDIEYFVPSEAGRPPRTIAFLGSMDWMPNIDGIIWFVGEIWPLVKRRFPEARLSIIGRQPVRQVLDLAARDASIRVTGTVPDVRPHLAEAEIMVVPLRVGGGTRIKIFEAMATAIPVVSTRIGAEGLPVKHGEEILLADTPADFAAEIGTLFERSDLRQTLGQQGCRLVRENYSWPSVTRVFASHCQEVAMRPRTNP